MSPTISLTELSISIQVLEGPKFCAQGPVVPWVPDEGLLRTVGTPCKALEHWPSRIPQVLRHYLGSLVWGHTRGHSEARKDGKQGNR